MTFGLRTCSAALGLGLLIVHLTSAILAIAAGAATAAQPTATPATPVLPGDTMHREPVLFEQGRFSIHGDLLLPRGTERVPVVVVIQGSGPTDRKRSISSSRAIQVFLNAGFGVLIYDKPGSGGSTGTFTAGRMISERAVIAAAGIRVVASHPMVDPNRIGLYGSSQAAYVMPLVTAEARVAFVIAWSCPMTDGIEQSAYQVEQYLRCAGWSRTDSARAAGLYRARSRATSYREYLGPAKALEAIPEVRDDLGFGGIASRGEFVPADPAGEDFLDPRDAFGSLDVPILALYGELDRNIDPVQGARAFERIIAKNPHPLSMVQTIAGADHNMVLTPDGCIQNQLQGYANVGHPVVSAEFYDVMAGWLERLRRGWHRDKDRLDDDLDRRVITPDEASEAATRRRPCSAVPARRSSQRWGRAAAASRAGDERASPVEDAPTRRSLEKQRGRSAAPRPRIGPTRPLQKPMRRKKCGPPSPTENMSWFP